MAAVASAAARLYAPPGASVLRPGQILREVFLACRAASLTALSTSVGPSMWRRWPAASQVRFCHRGHPFLVGRARPRRWRSGMTIQREAPFRCPLRRPLAEALSR